MKKVRQAMILMVFAVLACIGGLEVFGAQAEAAGGSSSLGLSASTVNIGDTVTVTMNVSADVYASFRMNLSYSSDVLEYTGSNKGGDCNGGGGQLAVLSEVSGGGTYSISCTFRAIAPGTATVTASNVEALAMETAEAISISGSSASVTVNNAAASPGANGGNAENGGNNAGVSNEGEGGAGNGTANLSADNSLKSLTISPGTLSPSFLYSTVRYTANVGSDVTSIAVDAQTSNAKATVESVTGNTDLQPGENTIKIVVKAENGTLATYTITVNRGGAVTEPESEETEEPEEKTEAPSEIMIGGIAYKIKGVLPQEELPEEFTKTTAKTIYSEEEVEAYSFPYGNLLLFYLERVSPEEDGQTPTGGFFFLNSSTNDFFPYIKITVGEKYVIVLPPSFAESVPEGYQDAEVSIGSWSVAGYKVMSEGADDFFLLYGVDKNGAAGWYQYDSVDMSLQRFLQNQGRYVEEEEPVVDTSVYETRYQELKEKYNKERVFSRRIIAGLSFLLAVAIIAIVNILIFSGRKKSAGHGKRREKDFDYIDFDDV